MRSCSVEFAYFYPKIINFMTTRFLCAIIILSGLTACTTGGSGVRVDTSGISLDRITIHRYDQDLFRIDHTNLRVELESLKPKYGFFLDTDLSDTVKLRDMFDYLKNDRNIVFSKACEQNFNDLSSVEQDLTEGFRHLLYYHPGFRIPRIYSYISSGDYLYPVRTGDSVLLIALDCYLGSDFPVYKTDGIPLYRAQRMVPDQIVPECFRVVCAQLYPAREPGTTLLQEMVEEGKRLWFLDAMLPEVPDHIKIGYTPEQVKWVEENEKNVWAAMIENQVLYSSSQSVLRSMMADGPFTPEFSQASPPRLGAYLGWQIVRQYMEQQDDVTLDELMANRDAQAILRLSKYKPGR